MRKKRIPTFRTGLGLALSLILSLAMVVSAAPPLPGAIFTTNVDGSIVNGNVQYEAKEDVYLDGGPGPNAPSKAAGLPEGDYYFQVTDPSGKDLLSTDHISCRKIHVNEYGVIDFVYPGTCYEKSQGSWVPVPCQHNQGVDIDHSELGAITVQLFPYDDTPNPGGVYKVWVTPVGDYAGDPDYVPVKMNDPVNGENYQPGNYHGFIPAKSKTDNYKVKKKGKPYVPPVLTILKFHDANLNFVKDADEEWITGWAVDVTDPLSSTTTVYTPATVVAEPAGTYTVVEEQPAGTIQTVGMLDGAVVSSYPFAVPSAVVEVAGESEETHEVIFGNVAMGQITACKVYDRNANGIADEDEPGIPGWKMEITGTDVTGAPYGPIVKETGEGGCVTFLELLPGTYTVTELVPPGGEWIVTGPTSFTVTIESSLDGSSLSGTAATVSFTNLCLGGEADFDTKGYWHNKNGLAELTQDDIDYVNGLLPYSAPSSYFGAGDEPFDGFFSDGTPVAASKGILGDTIASEGTWQAEVSQFLVDANAGGDPREQLAQQLLAFIFNTMHRLDNPGAAIELPGDGALISASELVNQAIEVWASGSPAEQTAMSDLLDALNNSDAVPFVPFEPCPVSYPAEG